MTWKGIVNRSFDAVGFDAYCRALKWESWRPQFVTLHNTAVPSLAQRPNGLSENNILALEAFYRDEQKWSSGPHLFVDDRRIWVFTPLTTPGTHSPSWNRIALGVEMLGDFASEPFDHGRGARVRDNAVAAIASLSAVLELEPGGMKLHKEDPRTTHDCPGKNVAKSDFIERVREHIAGLHPVADAEV
jgi:hypothetical protein